MKANYTRVGGSTPIRLSCEEKNLILTRKLRKAKKKIKALKVEQAQISDCKQALANHDCLVRELDIALNGERGAAKQASLCDIVAQVKFETQVVGRIHRTVFEMPGKAVAVLNSVGRQLSDNAALYAGPQQARQDGIILTGVEKIIAAKKSWLQQYTNENCHLEPDTNATVWDCPYDEQRVEDMDELITELEAVITATKEQENNG